MKNNSRVVSFERSSSYMHHRAMMNRRDNRVVDALELLRQAVERAPENREYRLDLAELYCEMGYHERSSRLLLDMLAEKDGPAECYYGLALNQLGMNDAAGARKSLAIYRRKAPEGEHSEEVENLRAELDMFDELNAHGNRQLRRAARAANRGCDAMREDMPDRACRCFEASLRLAPGQAEIRALYAMALMLKGDGKASRREAERVLRAGNLSARALCVCAQVLWHLGEGERAVLLARRAMEQGPDGAEVAILLNTLAELGMDAEVAEQARLALQDVPYDRELLHMRAVALKKQGVADAELEKLWSRILRIDPEDSVAQFYQKAAQDGALDACELDYDYQVPKQEFRARSVALLVQLSRGQEALRELWRTDAGFRSLLRWATGAQEPRLSRAALTALAGIEDEDARSLLREMIFSSRLSGELRVHGAVALKLRGVSIDELMPPESELTEGVLPAEDKLLEGLSVGERQLVRYASETMEWRTGAAPGKALALMWSAYRGLRGIHADPLIHTETAAAALVYNYLLFYGAKPKLREVAAEFGCAPRQLAYYARRMAGCIEKMEEAANNEDP